MSTSFYCSRCRFDHPGDCAPPDPSPPVASSPPRAIAPYPGVTVGKGLTFGGASAPLGPSARPPGMSPQDFDDLVDEYLQFTDADLTNHYRAAKEALSRKLGAAARSLPVPP